jgi:hypothetical protein
MPTSTINYTSAGTLRVIGIAMITITSVAFVTRAAARFHLRGWRLQLEDLFVGLRFVFFLAMSIAYITVINLAYRLADFQNGDVQIYATLLDDADLVVKVYFCTIMLLWLCLWSTKLAFLFLYRRLVNGLPHYIRWWWAMMIFCILVRSKPSAVPQMFTAYATNQADQMIDIYRGCDIQFHLLR